MLPPQSRTVKRPASMPISPPAVQSFQGRDSILPVLCPQGLGHSRCSRNGNAKPGKRDPEQALHPQVFMLLIRTEARTFPVSVAGTVP